jgi:hypothetical protein
MVVLIIKQCINGLRAIAENPDFELSAPVATFLGKKAHIEIDAGSGKHRITARGLECLADIEATIQTSATKGLGKKS